MGGTNVPDNVSIDSKDNPVLYSVRHTGTMQVACFNWSSRLSSKMKDVWNARATELNNRDVPGIFVVVPVELSGGDGPISHLP